MLRPFHLLPIALLCTPVASGAAGLPDTGQEACYTDTATDFRPPGNPDSVSWDAGTHPRQDCRYGRDPAANVRALSKRGKGVGGFDYNKITNLSTYADPPQPLGLNATDWACTLDQVTGLMWEVKTGGSIHLRSGSHLYTWRSGDGLSNGGNAGSLGANTCNSTLAGGLCNTQAYIAAVNSASNGGICSYTDWRLPSRRELLTILKIDAANGAAVDEAYFPNTASAGYWTATTVAPDAAFAFVVEFLTGGSTLLGKHAAFRVRLVRGPNF